MWIFGYGSLVWKADFPYIKKIIGYIKGYERKFWQASIDHRGVPGKPGRVVTLIPSADAEAKVWGAAYMIHGRDVNDVVKHLDLREVGGYEKIPVEFYPVPNHQLNLYDAYDSTSVSTSGSNSASSDDDTSNQTNEDISSSNHNVENKNNGLNGAHGHTNGQHMQSSNSEDDAEDYILDGHVQNGHFCVTMYYGNSQNEHFIGEAPIEEMASQIYESAGLSGPNKEYLYNLFDVMRQISDEANDPHLSELETRVRILDMTMNKKNSGRVTPIEL